MRATTSRGRPCTFSSMAARRRPVVALVAICLSLLASACGVASGVSTSTTPLELPTTTATTARPAPDPATTATTLARPVNQTLAAPPTAPPPTTVPPPPPTCGNDYYAADGLCYPTTLAPTTTLPPPAPPEPSPPLLVAVAPVKPGSAGDRVRALQQRLLDLGFWVDAVDGSYGHATKQAVMAFQKYYGLPATSSVDYRTAEFLNTSPLRVRAGADRGTLIEIDKAKQVLFVVREGRTVWAVNTSTGSGKPYKEQGVKDPEKVFEGEAVTPEGWFKVDRQREEGWWEGDLGKIYRPKYFRGGIAVHGMNNIPNRPVSHGCVRVSLAFMDFVWAQDLMPIGMRVWVHV